MHRITNHQPTPLVPLSDLAVEIRQRHLDRPVVYIGLLVRADGEGHIKQKVGWFLWDNGVFVDVDEISFQIEEEGVDLERSMGRLLNPGELLNVDMVWEG